METHGNSTMLNLQVTAPLVMPKKVPINLFKSVEKNVTFSDRIVKKPDISYHRFADGLFTVNSTKLQIIMQ